jgi:phosphoesterase RecJ-like protein
MVARHGLAEGRIPELIEIPVSLAATRIAFLLTEVEGAVRVSLRSRCPVGVHELAARHGGGGHPRAAGMTLPGDLEAAEALVRAEVEASVAGWRKARRETGLPPQDA